VKIRLPYLDRYRSGAKLYYYVRRKGRPNVRLEGAPGSAEFMASYQAALTSDPARVCRHGAGTFRKLVRDFYASVEFANLKPSSQRTYRHVLESAVEKHGHRPADNAPSRICIKDGGRDRSRPARPRQSHAQRHASADEVRDSNSGAQRQSVCGPSSLQAGHAPHLDGRGVEGVRGQVAAGDAGAARLCATSLHGATRRRRGADAPAGHLRWRNQCRAGKDGRGPRNSDPCEATRRDQGGAGKGYAFDRRSTWPSYDAPRAHEADEAGREGGRAWTGMRAARAAQGGIAPPRRAWRLRQRDFCSHKSLREIEHYTAAADQRRLSAAAMGKLSDE
jgi:hypothetical protein